MPNSIAVILSAIMATFAAVTGATASGDSLRSRVPKRWWESAAGLKVVTLKPGRPYAAEVLSLDPDKTGPQLDRIKAQGFQVSEIFAPCRDRQSNQSVRRTSQTGANR